MKNLEITRIEIEDFKKRDMSEIELFGAMLMIRNVINESQDMDFRLSVDDVDNDTFYTNKQLQINDGYLCTDDEGNLIKLHCVFCREGNQNILFGYASDYDFTEREEEDLFLVRID